MKVKTPWNEVISKIVIVINADVDDLELRGGVFIKNVQWGCAAAASLLGKFCVCDCIASTLCYTESAAPRSRLKPKVRQLCDFSNCHSSVYFLLVEF
jgi:hypothetical protein